jgi:hypothetical protein
MGKDKQAVEGKNSEHYRLNTPHYPQTSLPPAAPTTTSKTQAVRRRTTPKMRRKISVVPPT